MTTHEEINIADDEIYYLLYETGKDFEKSFLFETH